MIESQNSVENGNLDFRSDRLHPNTSSKSGLQWDLRSDGRHQEKINKAVKSTRNDFPSLVNTCNRHPNRPSYDHDDFEQTDEEDDYDNQSISKILRLSSMCKHSERLMRCFEDFGPYREHCHEGVFLKLICV